MRRLAAGILVVVALAGGASAQPRRGSTSKVSKLSARDVVSLSRSFRSQVVGDPGRMSEWLRANDLRPHDMAALRDRGGLGKFPMVGRTSRYTGARLAALKRDWAKVRSGKKTVQWFIDEHELPGGRNTIVHLQSQNPGEFTLEHRERDLSPARARRLSVDYRARVVTKKVKIGDWLAAHELTYEDLRALRRQPGGEAAFPSQNPRGGRTNHTVTELDDERLAQVKALYHRRRLGEMSYGEMWREVEKLGVGPELRARLRASDPSAFQNRTEFLRDNHDAIVADVLAIARGYRAPIGRIRNLFEIVNATPDFVARWGALPISEGQSSSFLKREQAGKDRIRALFAEELGSRQMARPHTASGARARAAARRPTRPDLAAMARRLAERLEAEDPSPERLRQVLKELTAEDPAFGRAERVSNLMDRHRGHYPVLARWSFSRYRKFSPRWAARYLLALHEAGAAGGPSRAEEIFRRSPEFAEDGRVPNPGWHASAAKAFPGLMTPLRDRRAFQRQRILLEALRTAPKGASVRSVVAATPGAGTKDPNAVLRALTPARMRALGLDPALLARLRAAGWTGLGEPRDPAFDPDAEPPGIDLDLARKFVDMPRPGPAMRHFLERLDGGLPYRGHKVLFVYHQYSDMVPMAEVMIEAGLSPKNTRFVKTAYPFDDAVSRYLGHLGIKTLEHAQDVPALEASIEQGIQELLDTNRNRAEPILIVDDGGLASRIIEAKFSDQMHRFKIFEITEAGQRLADRFKTSFRRLPIVYGSAARLPVKKEITSAFHARRVVDKVIRLVPQSGLTLRKPKVAIIGGGSMGVPAYREVVRRARELHRRGLEVTIIEPDEDVHANTGNARRLREAGIQVETMDQALATSGLVLGMTGEHDLIGPEHLDRIPDGLILVQGSSKRNEFDMAGFEKIGKKELLPRTDGLPQRSYTYRFPARRGRPAKSIHVLGDGWTINHDGSLHGTPIEDLDLELGIILEGTAMVARTTTRRTGTFLEVSADVQKQYIARWQRDRAAR